MVDATQRKLKVPARFVPYMEAHRLPELFHDLVQELVINQPDDHILFMKKTLGHIMHYRDRPRVVIIAPPEIDKLKLGELISNESGAVCVTAEDVHTSHTQRENEDDDEYLPIMDHKAFADETFKFLHSHQFVQNGWILTDFPDTLEEATALVRAGVLPTHSFHLTLKPIPVHKVIDYISTCKKEEDPVLIAEREIKKNYQRNKQDLLEVFHQSLNLIEADGRTLEDIAKSCSQLMTVRNLFSRPPMLPRILLLGPIGSGRNTQAELLCERFNLVHGRRYNKHTGTEYHLSRNLPYDSEIKDLKMQPQDDPKQVIAQHNAHIVNVQLMKAYAGGSGLQFDGTQSAMKVHELICDAVMKPSVCAEPRGGIVETNLE